MPADFRHIHLVAICGTGMAALARMLALAGYRVTGSDANVYPPMNTVLEREGIPCRIGFRPENIEADTDLVVIGNAVSKTNPEVEAVLKRGIPYRSFPQALSEFFLADRFPIVVVGTHGKTTTSALMAWILDAAGLEPGFLVGGVSRNFDANSRLGSGRFFVVEGDEYDTAFFDKGPKFMHYRPRAAILTSLEFDHGDIFKDIEDIKTAFKAFVRLIPADGHLLVVKADSPEMEHLEAVIPEARCRVSSYGPGSSADWHPKQVRFGPEGVTFRLKGGKNDYGQFRSPLIGRHNLINAIGVLGLGLTLGLDADSIRKGLESFQGVRRRQEILGEVGGVLLMDDFAHHPTAIRETLAGVRLRYPDRRIWAVFEPRSATSRRSVFQDEFPKAFDSADRIIIAGLHAPEKVSPAERLDPKRVVNDLLARGKEAEYISTADEIVKAVHPRLCRGDLICIMSSGGFDGLHEKILKVLGTIKAP